MTRAIRIAGSVLFAVLVAALGSCGGGGGGDGQADQGAVAPPATGGAGKILIKDFKYAPVAATVKLGQSITVTNEDSTAHTLTVPAGIDSGNLAKGQSFMFTPKEAGTIDYICDIHQYMKGRIIVE